MNRATVLLATALTLSCGTYGNQLGRAQRAFDSNQHEFALGLLRDLEPDLDLLTRDQRVQYSYLRGMTDYRIGYRGEARHWLGLAQAEEKDLPGSLPEEWDHQLNSVLPRLNEEAFVHGVPSLSGARRPGEPADETSNP